MKVYEKTWADPVGRVFYINREIYRGINDEYIQHVKDIFECGLIDELNEKKMIPYTWITNKQVEEYSLVLQHEFLEVKTYVQEWSFSMIKDAAIFILQLEKILLNYGYTLKDCHPYNIMFKDCKPIFVDFGSFERLKKKIIVRSFYGFYHQILEMFSIDSSIARDRIMTRMVYGVKYNNYYLYGLKTKEERYKIIEQSLSNIEQLGDIKKFEIEINKEIDQINSFYLKDNGNWGEYQDEYMSQVQLIHGRELERFKRIKKICENMEIKSIVELGANQGVLARMLADIPKIERIYATDYDETAIDKLYCFLKKDEDTLRHKIVPMIYNVESEILPCINLERFSDRVQSDLLIACALLHHLVLSQFLDIDCILDKMSRLTNRYLIIEFMPLGLWDGNYAPPIPAWYKESWFVKHLETKFKILGREQVSKNRIIFWAEKN